MTNKQHRQMVKGVQGGILTTNWTIVTPHTIGEERNVDNSQYKHTRLRGECQHYSQHMQVVKRGIWRMVTRKHTRIHTRMHTRMLTHMLKKETWAIQ